MQYTLSDAPRGPSLTFFHSGDFQNNLIPDTGNDVDYMPLRGLLLGAWERFFPSYLSYAVACSALLPRTSAEQPVVMFAVNASKSAIGSDAIIRVCTEWLTLGVINDQEIRVLIRHWGVSHFQKQSHTITGAPKEHLKGLAFNQELLKREGDLAGIESIRENLILNLIPCQRLQLSSTNSRGNEQSEGENWRGQD